MCMKGEVQGTIGQSPYICKNTPVNRADVLTSGIEE